jgi:hypothetical protein
MEISPNLSEGTISKYLFAKWGFREIYLLVLMPNEDLQPEGAILRGLPVPPQSVQCLRQHFLTGWNHPG